MDTVQVALTAFTAWLAYRALRETREMHRNATRPYLSFVTHFDTDEENRGVQTKTMLMNGGTGVAIVTRLAVTVDGIAIDAPMNGDDYWDAICLQIVKRTGQTIRLYNRWIFLGTGTIAPHDESIVVRLGLGEISVEAADAFYRRLNFIVEYKGFDNVVYHAESKPRTGN